MGKVRLFIAADIINEETITNIISFQSKFKTKGVKLTKESQFHFTFHFLGEIDVKYVIKIQNCLEKIDQKSFKIVLSQCGSFPNKTNPRVIWIGVSEGKSNLINIQENLIEPLMDLSLKIDTRKYHTHLTIARIKYLDNKSKLLMKNLLSECHDVHIGESIISKVHLIQSDLTPEGSKYTKLYTKDLS